MQTINLREHEYIAAQFALAMRWGYLGNPYEAAKMWGISRETVKNYLCLKIDSRLEHLFHSLNLGFPLANLPWR